MRQEEGQVNLIIKEVKEGLRRDIDAAKLLLGTHAGKEQISREKQMQAYERLTVEDMAELEQRHGRVEVANYVMDMEARRRRSNAQK